MEGNQQKQTQSATRIKNFRPYIFLQESKVEVLNKQLTRYETRKCVFWRSQMWCFYVRLNWVRITASRGYDFNDTTRAVQCCRKFLSFWRISAKTTFRIRGHFVKGEYERPKQTCNESLTSQNKDDRLRWVKFGNGGGFFAQFTGNFMTVRQLKYILSLEVRYFSPLSLDWRKNS